MSRGLQEISDKNRRHELLLLEYLCSVMVLSKVKSKRVSFVPCCIWTSNRIFFPTNRFRDSHLLFDYIFYELSLNDRQRIFSLVIYNCIDKYSIDSDEHFKIHCHLFSSILKQFIKYFSFWFSVFQSFLMLFCNIQIIFGSSLLHTRQLIYDISLERITTLGII